MKKITLPFAALAAIIAMVIPQACAGDERHGPRGEHAVREANGYSLRREQRNMVRHGHDKDGDSGSFYAVHARPFYTDWRIVRQRHGNTSGKGKSYVQPRGGGRKDVKSDCVQTGVG
jgi:hypothetical protein